MINAIGFTGAKGSGKDTCFQILKPWILQHYDIFKNVERIAFADPIKQAISQIFSISLSQIEQIKRINNLTFLDKNNNQIIGTFTGRDVVRNIGMLMRSYDQDQFIKFVKKQILHNPSTLYLITDVRFENERLFLNQHHYKLIKIIRPGVLYDNHITERDIKSDYTVVNDGDIEQLKNKLIPVIEEILNGVKE